MRKRNTDLQVRCVFSFSEWMPCWMLCWCKADKRSIPQGTSFYIQVFLLMQSIIQHITLKKTLDGSWRYVTVRSEICRVHLWEQILTTWQKKWIISSNILKRPQDWKRPHCKRKQNRHGWMESSWEKQKLEETNIILVWREITHTFR